MDYRIVPMTWESLECCPLNPYKPFDVIGRCIPAFDGENWSCSFRMQPENRQKCYPNIVYNPENYVEAPSGVVLMAVADGKCVGHIRVRNHFFDMGYVQELSVEPEYRRMGIGKQLMDAAQAWCRDEGMKRMALETQDNNVQACRFYLKYGFELCGIQTKKYAGSKFEDETAIYFYIDLT